MEKQNNVLETIVGAQLDDSTIELLLADLGERYQCERIYIFCENEAGTYDCSDEWVNTGVLPKKDLLQNLTPNAVKPYHDYFQRNGKLIMRDLADIQAANPSLYQMLKAQGLSSFLVGPLMYDGVEIGFMGIDNPELDTFEELESMFPIILYVVSIQKHRQEIQQRILHQHRSMEETFRNKKSMYDRAVELKKGKPLGIVYCSVVSSGETEACYARKEEAYVKHVLNSIFDYRNVFALGKKEFLILAEQTGERDLYDVDYYINQAKKTLSVMNIHLSCGVVLTEAYEDDFFDMVNSANAYMQRDTRKYRELYVGKYHFDQAASEFLDLIEIRPQKDRYKVVYSEHLDNRVGFEGNWSEFYPKLLNTISAEDKHKFVKFWNQSVPVYLNMENTENPVSENFHFTIQNGEEIGIEMYLMHYHDINGDLGLMCYTR